MIGSPPDTQSLSLPLRAYAPPMRLTDLGDPSFAEDHGVSFPYMVGAMANGIASVELVEAAAKAGLLGSFGAAGLSLVTDRAGDRSPSRSASAELPCLFQPDSQPQRTVARGGGRGAVSRAQDSTGGSLGIP